MPHQPTGVKSLPEIASRNLRLCPNVVVTAPPKFGISMVGRLLSLSFTLEMATTGLMGCSGNEPAGLLQEISVAHLTTGVPATPPLAAANRPRGGVARRTGAPRSILAGVRTPIPPGAIAVQPGTIVTIPGGSLPGNSSAHPAANPSTDFTAPSAMAQASAAPGVGACTAAAVTAHGGAVITNPKVHRLFWGSWNAARANRHDTVWKAIAALPSFYNRLSEYGIHPGSSGGRLDFPSGAAGNISESTLQSGVRSAIIAAGIISPTLNDVFMVFLPPTTISQYDIDNDFFGHHNSFQTTIGPTTYKIRYGVAESDTDDETDWTVSHELEEAFTSPDLDGWFDDGPSGYEIGDICDAQRFFLAGPTNHVVTAWSQLACRCVPQRSLNAVDFNATGSPSKTIYRPSTQVWWANGGSPNWHFGASGDYPYGGDYDGDGRTEFSLFRDTSPGTIFVLNVGTGVYNTYAWGASGDKPTPGDYDGDGRTDLATWRPSDGTWRMAKSSVGDGVPVVTQWGLTGDIPVPGDYDGDFVTDYAVFRPSDNSWYVLPSAAPGSSIRATWTGSFGDIPVAGDYNGDGKTDWAYWHPADGTFHVWYRGSATSYSFQWGLNGDVPVTNDYDGDWLTDLAVWRPSNGNWYILNSSTWTSPSPTTWGVSGDAPIERNILR